VLVKRPTEPVARHCGVWTPVVQRHHGEPRLAPPASPGNVRGANGAGMSLTSWYVSMSDVLQELVVRIQVGRD